MGRRKQDLETRFWSKINKGDPDSCWEWTSATTDRGYGLFTLSFKKQVYAHRLSYELTNGEIPSGLVIRHKCDNPPCCNPSHLVPGTQLDNTVDFINSRNAIYKASGMDNVEKINSALMEIQDRWALRPFEIDDIFTLRQSKTKKVDISKKYELPLHVIDRICKLKSGTIPKRVFLI